MEISEERELELDKKILSSKLDNLELQLRIVELDRRLDEDPDINIFIQKVR